jgi:Chitobiase/beta-hexosaminidase C-terminal domain
MKAAPKGNFATAPFLIGTLLLLFALTFYYFAVLKIDYRESWLLDLGHSDATEYFAQAKALLKDGWPSLQIGYDKLPSTYPCGYPTLMLPWLKILPEPDSILAPFRTNQTIGLLLLFAVFGFYAYLAMPLSGGLATLLLATLSGFFTFCRSSMSEISASALVVLAFMFAYLGLKEERRWKIYLSAVFLGLSLNIRLQSLVLVPLLLAMALFPPKGTRMRWFLHCLAIPIIFTLAASPVLILNTIQFHSPFKTGYDFWFPRWTENHLLFSFGYIPNNAATLWREFALRPHGYFVANIFGTGTCFVPAFVLLICAGLFFIRFSRFVGCAFLAGFSFFAAALSYKWGTDLRFYLPLMILLVGVAVLPVTWAAKNLVAGKRLVAAVAIFVLFAMACLGYPSRSGELVETNRLQAWDALHFNNPPRRSIEFVAQKRLVELFGNQPGIVFSDIDPAYLNALWPEPFVAAPVDGRDYATFSTFFHYDRAQATALVKRGLKQSLPIYALFVSQDEVDEEASRLPELDGYEWTASAQLIQTPSIHSVVSTVQFTMAALAVATPTMTPAPCTYRTYDGQKNVVISTTTPGAHLSYTIDGSTPTPTHGTITTYNTATIVIPYGTTTLKVMASRSGYTDSPVVSGDYTINRTTDAVILKLTLRNR